MGVRAIYIGDVFETNCHGKIEVIGYNHANDITVKFLNTGNIRSAASGNIQKGKVKDEGVPPVTAKRRKREERLIIGNIYENTKGNRFVVESYKDSQNVTIRFIDTGFTTVASTQRILKGSVRDYYSNDVKGVASFGKGKYNTVNDSIAFNHWSSMLTRCYSKDYLEKFVTYQDKSVCEEWLNFQNFAEWFYAQPNNDKGWSLDKDILVKGNTVYSPETCIFVPQHINQIIVTNKRHRGKYPIGVYWCNTKKRFGACLNKNGHTKTLPYSKTPEEAFLKYKAAKEQHIKDSILPYKDEFPSNLYDALYNYQVEITD